MKKLNLLISSLVLLFCSLSWGKNWDLNDVSILVSLPGPNDPKDFLLTPQSSGAQGALLPEQHRKDLEQLIFNVYDRPQNDYDALRVVALRIDPCFQFSSLEKKCHPVLRLIWQPLHLKEFRTYDAAVHSFYPLTPEEFKILVKKLKLLKEKNTSFGVVTTQRPLSVHPAYLNFKRRSSFNEELKAIILETAGEKNLNRFTIMKLLTKDIWWQFLGREKTNEGRWSNMVIPRLGQAQTQDFFNDDFQNLIGMKGSFIPIVELKNDDLTQLVRGPDIKDDEDDRAELKKSLVAMNRIENPRIHSPATMDCVHCHLVAPTRMWAQKVAPELVKRYQTSLDLYTLSFGRFYNLQNTTQKVEHNKSLRAFGYFDASPSINQRTINESSMVAEELNKMGL